MGDEEKNTTGPKMRLVELPNGSRIQVKCVSVLNVMTPERQAVHDQKQKD